MTRDSTRKEGRAHPDDPRVRILLHRIAAACRNTLGDTLAGVYVHGSLAFGCFCWTQSDIDFLVAVRRPLSQAQKEALLRALLALEPDAPSKGLEMSAVLEAYCRSFIHPAPYELHYSPMHRARCLRDLPAYCAEMHGADPDLAAHFTVARAVGLTLWGPPAESMFGPVPRAAYLDSIRQDVGTACSDILRTPASTTLNLCRTLAFCTGRARLVQRTRRALGRVPSAAPICRLRTKRGGKLPFRRAFFCPRPHRHRHSQPFFCRPSSTRISSGKTFEHKPGYDSKRAFPAGCPACGKRSFYLLFYRSAAPQRALCHTLGGFQIRAAHINIPDARIRGVRVRHAAVGPGVVASAAHDAFKADTGLLQCCAHGVKLWAAFFPYTPLCAAKTTCPLRSFPSQPLTAPQRCVRSRPAPAG